VTESETNSRETPQARLARKLNLLIDLFEAEGSEPLTYQQISHHMAQRGTPLSRSRWAYMRSGDSSLATDEALLRNLAKFFGVDSDYLLGDSGDVPRLVDAQLELLRSLREARVRNFAARQLHGISPETLLRLRKAIDERQGGRDQGGGKENSHR
jgi:transcriptional regulator with XRE-family HTH domain